MKFAISLLSLLGFSFFFGSVAFSEAIELSSVSGQWWELPVDRSNPSHRFRVLVSNPDFEYPLKILKLNPLDSEATWGQNRFELLIVEDPGNLAFYSFGLVEDLVDKAYPMPENLCLKCHKERGDDQGLFLPNYWSPERWAEPVRIRVTNTGLEVETSQ
ncbi:MAG: hypothetical protein AAF202_06380 [Pseudomonadota bacterium]